MAAFRSVCRHTTLDLSNILQFATCASEEPVLGFLLTPALEFVFPGKEAAGGFEPLAHTCTIVLKFPKAAHQCPLPPMDKVFPLYGIAFSQIYFGKK